MCSGAANGPPEIASLTARAIRPDDEAACQTFSCGVEEWQEDVNDFIIRKFWLPGRTQEETVIAFPEGRDDVFGFGAWKHTHVDLPQLDAPIPVIRIVYFGVDRRFQGARDPQTEKSWAGRLYATVESAARAHPQSTAGMRIELYCDHRNDGGIGFWQSRGFVIVDPERLAGGRYLQMLRVPA